MTNEDIRRVTEESDRIVLVDGDDRYYVKDGKRYKSVTQTLKERGYIHYPDFKDMSPYLTRGQDVHKIIHYDADGILDVDSVDESYMGYYRAYKSFESRFISQTLFSELKVFTGEVCGTLDCVARLKSGRLALIDWKTGQVMDWTKYQLGGLSCGFANTLSDLDIDLNIDVLIAVQLCPDGNFIVYSSDKCALLSMDFKYICLDEQPQSDVKLSRLNTPTGKKFDEFIEGEMIRKLERRNELLSYVKEYKSIESDIKYLTYGCTGLYIVGMFSVDSVVKVRNGKPYTETKIKLIDEL